MKTKLTLQERQEISSFLFDNGIKKKAICEKLKIKQATLSHWFACRGDSKRIENELVRVVASAKKNNAS